MKKVILGLSALALVGVSSLCLADEATQNPNQDQSAATTQQGTDASNQASSQTPAKNKQANQQNHSDTQTSDDNADLD